MVIVVCACLYSVARTTEECDPMPTGVGKGGWPIRHGAARIGAAGT